MPEAEAMPTSSAGAAQTSSTLDVADVIEIRDPEVDVEAIMAQVRQNVARRRAEGAYQEDIDAIADEVFAEVIGAQGTNLASAGANDPISIVLAELNARWMVREMPFRSQMPLFGPLIVAVRTGWNWMSTRWYVQAIVQQVIQFNVTVVTAFNEVVSSQQRLAEEVRQVKARCEQQQEEIAMLQEEIERLQTRVGR
jgi:hypothetical protein